MKKIIFTLVLITLFTTLYSEKSYRVLSRGLVRDNSTNLIWTRCPLTLNDAPAYNFQCNKEKKLYTWLEAVNVCKNLVHEGRSDWRLPSISELQSIIYYYHYVTGETNISQVIEEVFPNTITESDITNDFSSELQSYCASDKCHIHYWSSTSVNSGSSWAVNFSSGVSQWDTVSKYKSVRCVAGP